VSEDFAVSPQRPDPALVALLPHEPPMVLIDRVLSSDPECFETEVVIDERTEFAEADGVPAWVGIEYMAQTVAAQAGDGARAQGLPPAVGFLLGTRRFSTALSRFPLGSRLVVRVAPVFIDGQVGVFDCKILMGDEEIAAAIINTFQPPRGELDRFLGDGGEQV
jgi:predicted hotdog family 3-hydroxylacyl-ACP dehydratase